MKRKLFRTLCVIVLITLCIVLWNKMSQQSTHDPTSTKERKDKKEKITSLAPPLTIPKAEELLNDRCIKRPIEKLKLLGVRPIAQNIHFKRDGAIYRLRKFVADGKEGSFEKLVFYKEDGDGFAQIQNIPPQDEINPTREVMEKYIAGGEIIFDEADFEAQTSHGEIRFTLQEGNLTKTLGLPSCP